ncbi:hypothetical protein J5N97_028177 [Dioscorea zingiberensis]|uniref:Uncharacterized protein n=1 Tax=Dioscorea zingiberensis TaxID=325984 RepID=A0A9D5BYN5_9LILI|nr:hypothetical protein J5N97_028177 [Dioscorea zingiberensis]
MKAIAGVVLARSVPLSRALLSPSLPRKREMVALLFLAARPPRTLRTPCMRQKRPAKIEGHGGKVVPAWRLHPSLSCSPLAFASSKKPVIAARREDIPFIKCQICHGISDTNVVEFLIKSKPSVDVFIDVLCNDLSKACFVKPPSVPKNRLPDEPFVVKSSKEGRS